MAVSFRQSVCIAAALAVMTVGGCARDPLQLDNEPKPSAVEAAVYPAIGEIFQLRPGEVASLVEGSLLVAFHSVRQDSRCPVDVTCVWEGDAELYIGVAGEGQPWSWSVLHTAVEPLSREVDGLLLLVEGLDPAPRSATSIPSSAYMVSLRVTRR